MKKCSKCKKFKGTSEFNKNKSKPDGLQTECRLCSNKNNDSSFRKWYEANRERVAENHKKWYAKNKERAIAYSIRWQADNPGKVNSYTRKWRASHADDKEYQERKKQSDKKWIQEHPEFKRDRDRRRRARKKGSTGNITASEWQAVLDKYGRKCLYPGCERTDITMDHVKPLSLGGTHTADNVQPLCGHHNYSKGAKHIDYR